MSLLWVYAARMHRYVHESDHEFEPGDIIHPASHSGHDSQWKHVPGYDPHHVYISDTHDPHYSQTGNYGEHIYAVEPLGEVGPDPEVEHFKKYYHANPERAVEDFGMEPGDKFHDSDMGHANSARTVPSARVIRKL